MRACTVEMHASMSQEPLCVETYSPCPEMSRKKGAVKRCETQAFMREFLQKVKVEDVKRKFSHVAALKKRNSPQSQRNFRGTDGSLLHNTWFVRPA